LTNKFSGFASSALGVEVNPEAYSCALCFEIKEMVVKLWG